MDRIARMIQAANAAKEILIAHRSLQITEAAVTVPNPGVLIRDLRIKNQALEAEEQNHLQKNNRFLMYKRSTGRCPVDLF